MPELTLDRPGTVGSRRHRSRVTELGVVVGRCLRLARRDAESIVTALAMPIMIMLLFVYLFGGAIETGSDYVTYVTPGVLLLCVGFGAASTAVSVCRDLSAGIADRFRALDVPTSVLVNGQVMASLVRNGVATALVIAVAVAIGFRPHVDPLRWLAAAGVLAACVLALSWISAAIGIAVRTPEAVSGFSFFMSFLSYPSSAFVPIDTMPDWLQGFARNQPLTHVIEACRGFVLDRPVGTHAWWALGWSLALTALCIALAPILHRRRIA